MSANSKKREEFKTKIMALRIRLVYIVLRLFTWGALLFFSKYLKKCSDYRDRPQVEDVRPVFTTKGNE